MRGGTTGTPPLLMRPIAWAATEPAREGRDDELDWAAHEVQASLPQRSPPVRGGTTSRGRFVNRTGELGRNGARP